MYKKVHFLAYKLDNFYRNCQQFNKDIIKNQRGCFYETPFYMYQISAHKTSLLCDVYCYAYLLTFGVCLWDKLRI